MKKPTETVLLAVADSDLRTALRDLLQTLEYQVVEASSNRRVEELFQQAAGEITALVAEAQTSEGSRLELVDRLRVQHSALPTLLIANFGGSPALRERERTGNVGLLPVPFSARSLNQALRNVINGPIGPVPPSETKQPPEPNPQGHLRETSEAPAHDTSRTPRSSWLLAAAGLVLAGGLAMFLVNLQSPALPELPTQSVKRDTNIRVIEPVGEIGELPSVLRWVDVQAGANYRVEITGVDLAPIHSAVIERSPALLPVELKEQLHRAVLYTWQVEALDAEGALVARSEPIEFRIQPLAAASPTR